MIFSCVKQRKEAIFYVIGLTICVSKMKLRMVYKVVISFRV